MDQRPIGVFDSGQGGLTAVREIQSILPSENIIYFGDTSRVPYGGKSPEICCGSPARTCGFAELRHQGAAGGLRHGVHHGAAHAGIGE